MPINHAMPTEDQLLSLYADAGWTAYTCEPERLVRAVGASLSVLTAWEDDMLIGLVRAVGDGETILYLQDILVHSAHRRCGVGRALVQALLAEYPHVRQRVLLADSSPALEAFYRSLGFTPTVEEGCTAYVAFR